MEEENMGGVKVIPTINNEESQGEESGVDSGISSIPDASLSSRELVGTIIPDTEPEEANNTEAEEESEEKAETTAEEDTEQEDEKPERYDKIPRFQELKAERDKALERAILAEAKAKEPPPAVEPDYQDIMEMNDEELDEQWETDKKGFLANYAKQLATEIYQGIEERQEKATVQQKVNTTYDQYAKDNPDFKMMLDSGEIRTFISENPGHNAISAHLKLSGEAKTKAAVDAAVAEAIKKQANNQKVKRSAAVLNEDVTAPSTSKPGIPPELKNTKAHGGLTGALVARLQAARRAKAG